ESELGRAAFTFRARHIRAMALVLDRTNRARNVNGSLPSRVVLAWRKRLKSPAKGTHPMIRVGIGHDTHRLGPDRPLILGGLRIEHSRGLIGHSDADVVLHALTDAMLGAAGLGDIGDAYPDTDPKYKDCDSALFVTETLGRLTRDGWRVVNLDVTLFAQEPKLGPAKAAIRAN